MQEKYAQLALENTVRLLGIDSPSGYTENAAKYVQGQFAKMGVRRENHPQGRRAD